MVEEGTYSPEVSVGSIMLLRLVTTLWLKSPKTPEKIPTINPSNDPTRVPENSRLDRPLAHPSYQGELIIKVSPIYTYIHGQKVGYTLGISLINHVHSSLYTPTICTQSMGCSTLLHMGHQMLMDHTHFLVSTHSPTQDVMCWDCFQNADSTTNSHF